MHTCIPTVNAYIIISDLKTPKLKRKGYYAYKQSQLTPEQKQNQDKAAQGLIFFISATSIFRAA